MNPRTCLLTLLAAVLVLSPDLRAGNVPWQQPFSAVSELPYRAPDQEVAYGPGDQQFAELWLPDERDEAVPVVVLIHGGCWLDAYDIAHIRPLAAALSAHGMAVWAPEYRRVGSPGGGWPGTFRDIAAGLDALAGVDETALDLDRVALAGHSAGGHLALWAAARGRLPASSELPREPAFIPRGVIGLAAITDLAGYAEGGNSCQQVVPRLLGGMSNEQPVRYAQASPAKLGVAIPTILLHGDEDPIVPIGQSQRLHGARQVVLPGAGHFDLIHPESPAFGRLLALLKELTEP